MRGQQARLRQSLESTSRVLIGNLEDICDLVGGHEGPVVFYILQNVRGAPLREARRKVIDDRLERPCGERITLDDLASIAVPYEEGVTLLDALMCIMGVRGKDLL